jgi:hypothetical protein
VSKTPIFDNIRLIPRESEFLNRKVGSRGEIFYDRETNTLRLYNGIDAGGISLLRADLSNAEAVIGAALGDVPPVGATVQTGTIWFNTSNGRLYIYYNDGTSTQWVQPTTPSYGGGAGGGGATTIDELSDVTLTSPSAGQVLKYNGSGWVNSTIATGNPFDQSLNTTNNVRFVSTTASDFVLSGSGTPTVQSDTDLNLSAGNRVAVVSKTPFKFPSLTTAERDGMTAQNGDVIYNSSLNKLQVYAASAWVNLH